MMKANTRFLLVTQRYTVLELSLFILSDTVGPTVIAETKLRARLLRGAPPGEAWICATCPRAESSPLPCLPGFFFPPSVNNNRVCPRDYTTAAARKTRKCPPPATPGTKKHA